MYGLLADLIVLIHFAYVGFVVIGQLLILIGIVLRWQWIRNPWFRVIHLAMILIVAFEAMGDITCPLTDWEHTLRGWAGQDQYTGTFVARLARKIFYWVPTEDCVKILDWCYWIAAGLVLATICIAPPRFRRRAANPAPPVNVHGDLSAHGPAERAK
jgi:multisubunit Na+/H+ antiporter MnhB subunit